MRHLFKSLLTLLLAALPRLSSAGACLPAVFEPAVAAVAKATPGNASAIADAFLRACGYSKAWSYHDAKKYFQMNWHPGAPAGMGCADLARIGLAGDGGKTVCNLQQLLHASRPCRVVSIGSNGEPSFETAVHGLAPHCHIDTFDGTLNGTRESLRANLPSFIDFHPVNVDAAIWRRYASTLGPAGIGRISLLKMDCEGCEFDALPPFVENVCIDEILLELHACRGVMGNSGLGIARRVQRAHKLLAFLDTTYKIFNVEPNIAYGDGTCIEYSFMRRTPCAAYEPAF